jgi:hypothetical protein
LDQSRGSAGWTIADGIRRKLWCRLEFGIQREHLEQQRIAGIAGPHAGDETRRCENGEVPSGSPGGSLAFGWQPEQPAQQPGIADRGFQLLTPILLRGRTGADR